MLTPKEVRQRLLPLGIALRPNAADHGKVLVLAPYAVQLAVFLTGSVPPKATSHAATVQSARRPENEVKAIDFV